jgi:hypothetical protein
MQMNRSLAQLLFAPLFFLSLFSGSALAAPEIAFPPGVDWNNATPEQIREAVFAAAQKNPEDVAAVIEIVKTAMENVQKTGRFPNAGAADNKAVVEEGVVTLADVAEQIAAGAIQANPALAALITSTINNFLTNPPPAGPDPGGTTGGGEGVPPALPGGFGGGTGGGTTGGGGIYSR